MARDETSKRSKKEMGLNLEIRNFDIKTKSQAEDHFVRNYLVQQLKAMFVSKIPVNKGFASKIISNKGIFYVKFERSVKWIDEYTEKKKVYHTINKDLLELKFDFLMLVDNKGRIWKITREQIENARLEGYVRTTESQNEVVINIPNEWAERVL